MTFNIGDKVRHIGGSIFNEYCKMYTLVKGEIYIVDKIPEGNLIKLKMVNEPYWGVWGDKRSLELVDRSGEVIDESN